MRPLPCSPRLELVLLSVLKAERARGRDWCGTGPAGCHGDWYLGASLSSVWAVDGAAAVFLDVFSVFCVLTGATRLVQRPTGTRLVLDTLPPVSLQGSKLVPILPLCPDTPLLSLRNGGGGVCSGLAGRGGVQVPLCTVDHAQPSQLKRGGEAAGRLWKSHHRSFISSRLIRTNTPSPGFPSLFQAFPGWMKGT